MAAEQKYKVVRLRKSTYDALVRVKRVIAARGFTCLPASLRRDVVTLNDVVALGISAIDKAIGGTRRG